MNKSLVDKISLEFAVAVFENLPKIEFDDKASTQKALQKIDNEPAELLTFLAEVAQNVYCIKVLPKRTYPLAMIKQVGNVIKPRVATYSPMLLPVEERLTTFWMSLVRILLKFKSGYYAYDLTDKQLDDLEDKAKFIQNCALGYKVCSEKKVRELVEKFKV